MVDTTAYPSTRVGRGTAIATKFENPGAKKTNFRPVAIVALGQGQEGVTYSSARRQVFSALEVGNLVGFRSPLYHVMESLKPATGVGVGDIPVYIHPLQQPTAGGQKAAGAFTPVGTATKTQTFKFFVGNRPALDVVIVAGDSVAECVAKGITALNSVLGMPGVASDGTTNIAYTMGWEGETGNLVRLRVESPDGAEITWSVTQPTGGAGTVDVNPAAGGEGLALIGENWDSHLLNCLAYNDSTNLGKYEVLNEARWAAKVHKPFVVFTGTAEANVTTVAAIGTAHKAQRTHSILTNPGSDDLPWVIAADQLVQIANVAQSDPPHDYGSQLCSRLVPGADADQWNDENGKLETAVLAGISTVTVRGKSVYIRDVFTTYHPDGEEPPGYRYVVDIEKIAAMIFSTSLIFDNPNWDGAPLVPDGQAVRRRSAKKPSMAKGALASLYDDAALEAVISDPAYAKANTLVGIGTGNPKRLDIREVFKLGGNANVISIDLAYGFHVGTQ